MEGLTVMEDQIPSWAGTGHDLIHRKHARSGDPTLQLEHHKGHWRSEQQILGSIPLV